MPNPIRHDLHTIDETSFPYVFEQNATIELKSSDGLVRCNIYRPKGSGPGQRVPVLVTYGPYGKDTPYGEYVSSPSCRRHHNSKYNILYPFGIIRTDMISTVFMRNPSLKLIPSTSRRIRPGRRRTRASGPATDMPSYVQTNAALDSPVADLTPCLAGPVKPSSKS